MKSQTKSILMKQFYLFHRLNIQEEIKMNNMRKEVATLLVKVKEAKKIIMKTIFNQ